GLFYEGRIMTSREKFEAWFLSEHEAVENSNELSAKLMKMMAWQSWQAAEIAADKKLTDMAIQLANAESKCRELAAESSRVKLVASNLVSEYISNKGTDCEFISCITPSKNTIGTGGVWDMWRLLDLVLQETPATDAFLAEVRAQGVEMFADFCGEENSVFVEAKAYYRSLPGAVAEFAVKLRKGAAL
ncbi:MAG: hypothetical protein RSG77_26210, partial [Hafnia sp.]